MEFTTQQIGLLLNGRVEGDLERVLNMVGPIEKAKPDQLAFLSNPKYEKYVYTTLAGAILVRKDFIPKGEVKSTLIYVDDPYMAFTRLLKEYEKQLRFKHKGIEQPSSIHETVNYGNDFYLGSFGYVSKNVKIGNNVKIHPHCFIGEDVQIGDHTILYPNVKIYPGVRIGTNCIIHSGAVIGSDGFGFAPKDDGTYDTIPQLGTVLIEDNVSIGSNTVIDRATLPGEVTYIRSGVKLDNLIQIAHNVEIGENTVIAAQTGISGSTKVGKNCMLAGQVGIAGHLEIADGVQIGAQAGISKSLKKKGQRVIGYPAYEFTDYFKSYSVFKRLPDMYKRLGVLEKELENQKD